jgi:hypothetical protein
MIDRLSAVARHSGWPARAAAAILVAASCGAAAQSKDFNACALFTAEDAAAALGAPAEPEVVKGKPPRIQPNCQYTAALDGKPLIAAVQFRFFKSSAEALAVLKESRLEARGRPFIIGGQDAYWHPKLAHLVIAKGSALITVTAGPAKEAERLPDPARKAVERLLPKLG